MIVQRMSFLMLSCFVISLWSSDCNVCTTELAACNSEKSPAGMTPTFFRPRNITTDSTFELALDDYNRFYNKSGCWGDLYVRPFYQKSFYGAQTARYFLPSGTDRIRVGHPGDVNPIWLQLVAPAAAEETQPAYNSNVAICPTRQTYGALLTLNLYPTSRLFFNVHFAAMKAVHDLRVQENARTVTGALSDYRTFCDAMNAKNMLYGKMSCRKVTASGIDDVQFKLGYDFVQHDRGNFMLYLIGTAPTGKRNLYEYICNNGTPDLLPNDVYVTPVRGSEYMFQALVGNRQGSFGVGLNTGACLHQVDNTACYWLMDVKFNYYFSARERRTFDLRQTYNATGTPATPITPNNWSRYLLLVDSTATLIPLPAVNYLSIDAKVRPGAQVQLWTAMHLDYCDWQIEAGYNYWYRQQENLRLLPCSTFPTNFGIYDIAGVRAGAATSSLRSVIYLGEQNPSDAPDFYAVEFTDLNATSAAHPATASSKFYGSLGRNFTLSERVAIFLGVNGSVEFAHNYAALNQGALWATFGLLF